MQKQKFFFSVFTDSCIIIILLNMHITHYCVQFISMCQDYQAYDERVSLLNFITFIEKTKLESNLRWRKPVVSCDQKIILVLTADNYNNWIG